MKGYVANIEDLTKKNDTFRAVLYTAKKMQLVLMKLNPGEEIGEEVHADNDQFFRVEHGHGTVVIDGNTYTVSDGSVVIVPAGATHNIINASDNELLKMYTIYAPPHHQKDITHKTKEDAVSDDEEFDGATSE